MKFIGTELTRNIERDMFDYMPKEYADYKQSSALIKAEAVEYETLNSNVADVLAQFFIDTATWGLGNWERIVGVPTDLNKPLDQRRSVVKSKIRGIGTVTVGMIKNVAESYANAEVAVTEDVANYAITVTFIGARGNPPNINDIKNAIRDIIPAHMSAEFKLTFVSWGEIEDSSLTFSQAETYTWDSLETSFLNV